jgi:hypothetical protein
MFVSTIKKETMKRLQLPSNMTAKPQALTADYSVVRCMTVPSDCGVVK